MNKKHFLMMIMVLLCLNVGLYIGRVKTYEKSKTTNITFEKEEINIGDISIGDEILCEFNFYNLGYNPAIIYEVKADCGCLETEFCKNPISTGESGHIKVKFNADYKGWFVKPVSVYHNGQKGISQLIIMGCVI
ncbi:MAG: DUF1573 domain-containing protein [Marinilabiliaceae bacterium]|nr:DUF1573 domain-containing protein [Marinilabiliaceae bacterium]